MTQKKIVIAAVLIVLLPSLIFLGWLGLVWMNHHPKLAALPPVQTILHSHRPDGAVIIPFRTEYQHIVNAVIKYKRQKVTYIIRGGMFVTVMVGNNVMTAEVDTGSSSNLWPANLQIGPIRKRNIISFSDIGQNHVWGDLSILDSVWIGDLELRHLPSYAINRPGWNVSQDPRQADLLTLGDAAFAGLVLTIDYPNHQLILHPAGYQPPKSARAYPCLWTNTDTLMGGSVPAIAGTVEGSQAYASIDTGWATDTVGLSQSMYQKILPRLNQQKVIPKTEVAHGAFGQGTGTFVPQVHWTLPGIAGSSPAEVVSLLPPHQDMVLGSYVLAGYQVTIDYPGKRVWLERPVPPARTLQTANH